ncbi:MAG: HEAT repeat domain-containing protein [bacterium]|nr:HEAT repeat domain-containing protein [bacterium]
MISGESFQSDWQNSIITCDFRANRVTRFSLQEQDAGYITTQEPDLVRTSAATFRPIDVKQGPDGALYIADWSNPIINHGEVDFRDPRRDRWHGRIWRVRWKGAADQPKRDLTRLESSELLSLVKSQDRYLSHQSSRVLIERGEPARTAIRNWLEEQTDEYDKLKALWLCQATDSAAQSLLEELLVSKDHRIRAAATRVLGCWTDPQHQPNPWLNFDAPETHARFVQAVNDSHPRVRLEAIRALAKVGSLEAGTLALQVLEHPMDRFLDHALFLTVNEMADPLMQLLEQQQFEGTDQQLDFILTAIEPDKAKRFLAQRLANEPLAKDGSGPWIELIGKTGGPEELNLLMMQALSRGFDEEATERAVNALVMAQRLRKTRPSKPASLDNLFGMPSEPVRLAAIRLAEVWQGQGSMTSLIDFATRDSLSMKVRLAAIQALKSIGGSQAVGALTALANDEQNQDISRASTLALAALETDTAIKPFFAILSKAKSEAEALDLWRGILGVQGMGNKLAEQLQNQSLNDEQLMAGLRSTRDGGRQESRLGDVLRELMGDSAASLMTPEAMLALASRVSEGDPARGEGIYRRTELACATCHAIGGIGGKVGPDMTSLGASAPVDYLVESLFIPDAKVKEGYHSSVVVTEDNQIISGIEVESTEDELVLRNAQDRLIRLPKIDIVGKKPGPSLMPVGVVDRLSEQEQLDLLSFLSQLGKPGPFDASQGGVAREYGVLAGTHRREQQGIEQIISGEIDGWQPLKSLVNGDLPRQELVELTRQPINIALVHVYLKTRIEVARDTTVRLSVPTSVGMWVNGQPIEGDRDFSTELPTGQHVVVIRLDARDLPEQFRLESKDVTFLALED